MSRKAEEGGGFPVADNVRRIARRRSGSRRRVEAFQRGSAPFFLVSLKAGGTVEEKVLALHERKRALSGAVLDGASDSALSEDDLLALLRRD